MLKYLICFLALTSFTTSLQLKDLQNIVEQIKNTNELNVMQLFAPNQEGKYDQCITDLENTMKEVAEITKVVIDKKYDQIVPMIMQFGMDLMETTKCFRNTYNSHGLFGGDKKQCVLDHFKCAFEHMKLLLKDLSNGDREGVKKEFQTVVDTLKDIKNC